MSKKIKLKAGEKVLFGGTAIFIVLAIIGYVILETVRLTSDKPLFEVKTHFDLSKLGHKGSAVFRASRCTSCHRAMNNGTNMGLSLDGIGSKRTQEWILTFLMEPEKTYEARTLDHGLRPKEAAYVARMPKDDLVAIAAFLYDLKSDPGSSTSPQPPPGKSPFIDSMIKTWAPEDWKEKYTDIRDKDSLENSSNSDKTQTRED